jgi:hypothetical protein
MVEKIIIGKDWKDLKNFGEKGTAFIGKHIVGKGEESHLTNPVLMDLTRPHIVLVCGKRGTGKCMVGDTPIVLANGSILPIREIVDSHTRDKETPKDGEHFVKLQKPLEVLSLADDLKIKKKAVSHVYKKRIRENIIRIRTRSGREIKVTREHPLLSLSGDLEWIPADKMKKGDYIALTRKITASPNGKFKFKGFGRPSTQLKSRIKSDILESLMDGGRQISLMEKDIGTQKVWDCSHEMASQGLLDIRKDGPLVAELTDYGRNLTANLDHGYRRPSAFSLPVKIPKILNSEFAEFVAYITAEGCEQKDKNRCRFIFSNSDPEKIERFKALSNSLFGLLPSEMHNGAYIDSVVLEKIMASMGYVTGRKSKDKDIPQAILASDDDCVRSFLRAFFDCEAWVSKRSPEIEISSASREVANKLSLMLLRFEIFSIIKSKLKYATNTKDKTRREYFCLNIYGSENLHKFAKEIGFGDKGKSERLEKYADLGSNPNLDTIPNVGPVIKELRRKIGLRACDIHKFKQVAKSYEDGKYRPTRGFLKNVTAVLKKRFGDIETAYGELTQRKSIEHIQKIIEITPIQWKDIFIEMGVSYTGKDAFNFKLYRTPEKRSEIISIISGKIKDILHKSVLKKIEFLDALTESDIFWDMITEIREEPFDDWVYDLTVPETHNFIAGSGIICHNSYSAGVIAEEIYKLPDDIRKNLAVILIDTMGIYWSMKLPNEKEIDLLKEWNIKPEGVKTKFFVPKGYVNEYKDTGITIDSPFTLSVGELTAEDWAVTFGFSMIDEHGILLEKIMEDLGEKYEDKFSIRDIINEIEKDKTTEKKVKDALVNRFIAAETWGLFDKEGTKIEEFLRPGAVSVIDVSHYMSVSESWSIRAMVVGLISRKIFTQRLMARKAEEYGQITGQTKKTIPLIWIMMDEAHQFVPSEGATAATGPLLTLVKEGREPGISVLMITQRPNKLHEDALSQADIIISHRLTSKADIEALRSIMQTYMLEDIQDYLNDLPKTKGSAILLDDNSERIYQVQVRPRLSWHAGGSPIIIKEKSLVGGEK